MAGGVGSRLWPLSTPETPKQFIDVLGVGKTLIQLTVERFIPVCSPENFWVVTGEKYVDLVKEQIPGIPEDQILAEPEGRNTAPCIAYASWKIALKDPDANIVVTPADALVLKTSEFADAIGKALAFTENSDAIVTVGIAPTRPETGYGYIHASEAVRGKIVKVSEFKEKPSLETAQAYLADGHYFWNAGIFVWNVKTIVKELRAFAPQISAVMEKSRSIYVIADDLAWSDLGSWGSVKGHIKADDEGNVVVGGDVRLFGCKDCFVHAASEKRVVLEGLDGYIVSESDGRLLVCRLSEEQHIKEFSA